MIEIQSPTDLATESEDKSPEEPSIDEAILRTIELGARTLRLGAIGRISPTDMLTRADELSAAVDRLRARTKTRTAQSKNDET